MLAKNLKNDHSGWGGTRQNAGRKPSFRVTFAQQVFTIFVGDSLHEKLQQFHWDGDGKAEHIKRLLRWLAIAMGRGQTFSVHISDNEPLTHRYSFRLGQPLYAFVRQKMRADIGLSRYETSGGNAQATLRQLLEWATTLDIPPIVNEQEALGELKRFAGIELIAVEEAIAHLTLRCSEKRAKQFLLMLNQSGAISLKRTTATSQGVKLKKVGDKQYDYLEVCQSSH